MPQKFPVLLVDDGELNDVRDALLALHVEFAHLRGGAVPATIDAPRDLFVATARRAQLVRPWPHAERPVRVAVVTEDSETLRATLRQLGFAFLVRRPVHAVALRLLLQHALYRGQERRAAPRVPLGHPVAVKVGMRRRDALLADLSENGCRVLASWTAAEGARVTVQVPSELCGEEGFVLPGRVVRCTPDRSSPGDATHAVAIQFAELTDAARALLANALEAHRFDRSGAPTGAPDAAWVPTPQPGDDAAPRLVRRVAPRPLAEPAKPKHGAGAPPRARDRRRDPRRRCGERVIAASADGSLHRILIGRDLSCGGMRIDPQLDFAVGTRLRVALYDATREAPVVVDAVVVRDDGPGGAALRFAELAADARARLEQLVAGLPPVECLADGETGALGTVVGEIVR